MALQMATAGMWGMAPQAASGTAGSTFYWYPLVATDFGITEGQDNLPMETGKSSLQRGRFKTGVLAAGTLQVIPRLDNRLGWLLEAAFGEVSSFDDTTIDNGVLGSIGGDVGVNAHNFYFLPSNDFYIPYFTTHRLLPNLTSTEEVGEIAKDCHVVSWMLAATPAAIVGSTFGVIGKADEATIFDINPGWGDPDTDDDSAFMVTSCSGSVEIEFGSPAALVEYDTGGLQLSLVNNVLPPDQARKIGSGHPIDFPVLSRTLTLQATCFVDTYDLYVEMFGGAGSGGADAGWSCEPLMGDFDITLQSAKKIGATTSYHSMRILTSNDNVAFFTRPIQIAPNQPVIFQIMGSVQRSDSGHAVDVWIQNGQSSSPYAWPT